MKKQRSLGLNALSAMLLSVIAGTACAQTEIADARMDEIYWAKYESPRQQQDLPKRLGNIHLSKPEELDLTDIQFVAGSALKVYGDRLFTNTKLPSSALDAQIHLTVLGVLDCAVQMFKDGRQIQVRELEPLYIRDKVALTTQERLEALK